MNRNEIYRIYGTDYKEMTIKLLTECDLRAHIMGKCRHIHSALSEDQSAAASCHDAYNVHKTHSEKDSHNSASLDICNIPGAYYDSVSQNLARPDNTDFSNIRIGIKPNLVSPTPASFGATTHPEVVVGIIEYLKLQGFTDITILEGSWVGDKTAEAFEYCGYNKLSQQYDVPLFDTQKDSFFAADCSGLELNICSKLKDIDYLINVPVLKGHCQTHVTCALKNMKGLIPNSEKRHFHSMGLHKPIAHLNTYIHQDFIVIDHICGDPDIEDGGNPLVRNCIMASVDPVLTDSYVCRVLGYDTSDVRYITLAAELGVGSSDLNSLQMITIPGGCESLKYEEIENQYIDSAENSDTHRIVSLNYAVEEVDSCSACYSYLMSALDRLRAEGKLSRLTDELNIRFCIGQGYRNADTAVSHAHDNQSKNTSSYVHQSEGCSQDCINYIGIGACTHSFEKNIPGCPPSEDTIYEYLVRLLIPMS